MFIKFEDVLIKIFLKPYVAFIWIIRSINYNIETGRESTAMTAALWDCLLLQAFIY